MGDTNKVLIVEDSKFFASILVRRIINELGFDVDWKSNYADAVATIECCQDDYFVALLDVTLPDAPNGEIVNYALGKGMPSIIFTGGFDGKLRNQFVAWNIVDYILKDSASSVDMLLSTVHRIYMNRDIKALVVDDSKTMRDSIVRLLKTQLYQVFEAGNGNEALEVLGANPEIKLIVSDYEMPEMDGFELIKRVRETYSKNDLAIIGMSAMDAPLLSAQLLKTGANDFVSKPFQVEEFHSRVSHSMEMLENIALIRDLSYKDPLTKLYNRRYFFENAQNFIRQAEEKGRIVCVGMLDIDHFKNVNDTYGHDGGDTVLKEIACLIQEGFQEDSIVSRFGGEEFCVMVAYEQDADVVVHFDAMRQSVEDMVFVLGGQNVHLTISVGVCCAQDELDVILKLSDSRLYAAKEGGRNRVVAQ
ncbi:diguanylate cyclase [Pseudodesulfovibrio piezophilus]|nr:diguanylate cyclase [Pseudodesulfovibrio piezophilus]